MFEDSEEDYSFEEQSLNRPTSDKIDNFSSLFLARDRFQQFVEGLGETSQTEIREDILTHCEQSSRKDRSYEAYMSEEMILRIINLRIEKYYFSHAG